MYQVYEHGKDEHGGYHISPCGEGWCDTFEEAASLSEAWNGDPTEEGWEWLRYYPIWVHTQHEKTEEKIAQLTTDLDTAQREIDRLRDSYSGAMDDKRKYKKFYLDEKSCAEALQSRVTGLEGVLGKFSYVEIVSAGCEGWVNLFFGEYPVALIDNEAIASEIKETVKAKQTLKDGGQ